MILFILPNLSGGGAERATINLLTRLHQKKHPVMLIVFDKCGPLSSMVSPEIDVLNLKTLTLRKSVVPLIRKIYFIQPKVIFTTFGYINLFLILASFFIPGKFLIWAREANLPSKSLFNNKHSYLMGLGYRWIYRYADRILCTSYKMKNEFIDNYHVPSARISILPNPIDEQLIRKMSCMPVELECNNVCFVAAGRLVRQKGFDQLLQWFAQLDSDKSKLYILGEGPMRLDLEKITVSLDLSDRVFFIGFCDNPWNWIANADAFLLSSRWEGMSNVVLEALSCGTPVIATVESGGISELAKNTDEESVIVATTAQEFQQKMNQVRKNVDTIVPRKSLLPDVYKIDRVVNKIEAWLD
jgi:glycosyltransferase involved in cell wall biosynthesis